MLKKGVKFIFRPLYKLIKKIYNKFFLNKILGDGKIIINFSGNNNIFKIGKNNFVKNDILIEYWGVFPNIYPQNVSIKIGDGNNFNGEKIKFISPVEKNRTIEMGNSNLFGGYITFRGRNDHTIYDINFHKKVNIDCDIIIGDNVWICDSVTILSKANIKGNAIIAEGSIVNKIVEEKNVLLAGRLISIKKRNVMWNVNYLYEGLDNEIKGILERK